MKFGPVPIGDAAGAILAHTARLPGGAIKKGTHLSQAELARLAEAGYESVIAARLEAGDVGEDKAAARIAAAVTGPNLTIAEAFTGRVNIFAEAGGLALVDAERLVALNNLDDGLTVATLAPFARVSAGQMVATIKIIPFALPDRVVTQAEQWLAGAETPPVAVAGFTPHRAHLILTELPGTKPSVLDKRRAAIEKRLEDAGSRLIACQTVNHETDAVAAAIRTATGTEANLILVFGASAIVDRDDVIPLGIARAGGRLRRFGMPVDPGNLLLLGDIAGRTAIGVPSCASSPKTNGLDWVLERTLAGLEVTSEDISAMAVGGLLMEIQSRPQPREKDDRQATRRAPRIAALVLAAGRSTRMGERNKLLEVVEGQSMVRHAVAAARQSNAGTITVVTGHEADQIRGELAGSDVTFVDTPDYAEGLATSLVAGLNALPDGIDGVIVLLGDMPGVSAGIIDRLIAAFAPDDGRGICVPTSGGRRGNPVLWAKRYIPEMKNLKGDVGAKSLFGIHSEDIAEVPIDTGDVLTDIDTPEALDLARQR